MQNVKTFLLATPFFSGRVPPFWSNLAHFTLGALVYLLWGLPALIIPLIKEAIDLWLWDKNLFSKHHKLYKDLAGWYIGMVAVHLIKLC